MDIGFSQTYFTGAQAQIYLGDKLISEVNGIEGAYTVNQVPIYGYASHHFDAVAQGRVIAQGSISINYIFDGYLYAALKGEVTKKENTSNANTVSKNNTSNFQSPVTPVNVSGDGYYKDIDTFRTPEEADRFYADDETIANFRKSLWADENSHQSKNINGIHPLFTKPCTIRIQDFRVGSQADGDNYEEKILYNVFFTNMQTSRTPDGRPTQEVYQFLARTFI